MANRRLDLVLVTGAGAVAAGAILFGIGGPLIRAMMGMALVLVLPGYAGAAALFGDGLPKLAERAALSVGISLSLTAIVGLALNWTPWGLRRQPFAALLGGITVIAGTAALVRARESLGGVGLPRASTRMAPLLLTLTVAAAMAAASVEIDRSGARQIDNPAFTQLWLLPDGAYQPTGVRLGIISRERDRQDFRMQLTSNGHLVQEWQSISLVPGATWQARVNIPASLAKQRIQLALYRSGAPDIVYRHASVELEG